MISSGSVPSPSREPVTPPVGTAVPWTRGLRWLAVCAVGLVLCFAKPLVGLVKLAQHSGLYSYILLIPFISGYFVWLKKAELQGSGSEPDRKLGVLALAVGLMTTLGFLTLQARLHLAVVDVLAWNTFSFVLLFFGLCCFFVGRQALRSVAFPLGFLIFLVPLPLAVKSSLETFLQHSSAFAAGVLFTLVGTPFIRNNVIIQLPGITLQVAPECSGIHSTLVLFVTSLIAGQLFLRSNLKRVLFALVVIPLGIFRNAIRIVTIGELCVHLDPSYIDSPIHHKGGPFFFVISMVPFLLLLFYLRKLDLRKSQVMK